MPDWITISDGLEVLRDEGLAGIRLRAEPLIFQGRQIDNWQGLTIPKMERPSAVSLASLASVFRGINEEDVSAARLTLGPAQADFVCLADLRLEIFGKPGDGAAARAAKWAGFAVAGQHYRRLVTAVERHLEGVRISESHGWPILSVGGDTPTVTEAAGASSSGRGGR